MITVELAHRSNSEIDRGAKHVDEWCRRYGIADHRITVQRFVDAEPAKIVGYAYPDATGPDLDLALDMMCFFNAFDDCFESAFWAKPAEAVPFVASVASALHSPSGDEHGHGSGHLAPIAVAFKDMWRRSTAGMSPQWISRATHTWTQYLWGYISESTTQLRGIPADLTDYLRLRRSVIGTAPCFDMIERAHRYEVPSQMWFHGNIRRLSDLATDIVILCNDLASVDKELARGDTANSVLQLMSGGASRDQAEQQVDELISELVQGYRNVQEETIPLCNQLQLSDDDRHNTVRWTSEVLEWAGASLTWQSEVARYHGKAKAVLPDAEHMASLASTQHNRDMD